MKRFTLLLLTIAMFISLNAFESRSYSDFCDGFTEGFSEGYKDVKGQYAVVPPTPTCPIAEIGKNTYKGGYNTGFKVGSKKAKE